MLWLGCPEWQLSICCDLMQYCVKVFISVAIIDLPPICELDAYRRGPATDVEALPGPKLWKANALPRKPGGNDLVTTQLIGVDSELSVEPAME